MSYQYTQKGRTGNAIVLVAWACAAIAGVLRGTWAGAALSAIVLLPVAALLSRMTIRVTPDALEWWFAGKYFRQRIPLRDVRRAAVVKLRFLDVGIHSANLRDWRWSPRWRRLSAPAAPRRNGAESP